MARIATFQLSLQAAGVAALQDFKVLFGRDPDESFFQEYAELVGTDGTGAPIEAGLPIARAGYRLLKQSYFDNALAICPGAAATVYLRTRMNEGEDNYRFRTYLALMKRPRGTSRPGRLREDVVFEFVNLIQQS